MRHGTAALLAMVLVPGCTVAKRGIWLVAPRQSEAERLVGRADNLARADSPREARDLYLRVLHDFPDDPAAPRALYGLGQLRVDPKSPLRDYAAARLDFGRLVARYPTSPWAPEARAWHAALSELLKHEADAARTRGDLERLKELDKELEER